MAGGAGSPSKDKPPKGASSIVYSDRPLAPLQVRYDHVLTGYRFNHSPWEGVTGLFELHFEVRGGAAVKLTVPVTGAARVVRVQRAPFGRCTRCGRGRQ